MAVSGMIMIMAAVIAAGMVFLSVFMIMIVTAGFLIRGESSIQEILNSFISAACVTRTAFNSSCLQSVSGSRTNPSADQQIGFQSSQYSR